MMQTKILDFDEVAQAQEEALERHFFTTFNHLGAHNGFRRGVLSGYIGTTGSGKSSLMKTLALQAVTNNSEAKALYWLSEEALHKYGMSLKKYVDKTNAPYHRIEFFEESSMDHKILRTHQHFLMAFREIVERSMCQILFIDNLTTSRLYKNETGLMGQGQTVEFLKNLAKDLNIAIVYLAHTESKVSDNQGSLIAMEDIRGSKDIVIQSSYFYILQKFTQNGQIFLTLRTVKSRDHNGAFGNYLLKFDAEIGLYIADVKVEFEEINAIFKRRDYLGRK
jgi:transcriptional regulator with XRE-family HTH domain